MPLFLCAEIVCGKTKDIIIRFTRQTICQRFSVTRQRLWALKVSDVSCYASP